MNLMVSSGDTGTPLSINFSLINPSPTTYSLNLTNDGNGSAAASPNEPYNAGTSVTVTANPNNGFEFENWTNSNGVVVSTANPYTFSINANTSLRANFKEIPPVTYTVTLSNDGNGTASASPNGPYTAGTAVTLTANPNNGFEFSSWTNSSGTVISTANPYTFNINSNQSIQRQL